MGNKYGKPLKIVPNEEELLIKARELRARGMSWDNLALAIGQSKTWTRYRVDPTYRERRRAESAARSEERKFDREGYSGAHVDRPALTHEELRERLSLVPKDTRDLTGRLFGDPIPNDPRRQVA
jgi:hypothetical protein